MITHLIPRLPVTPDGVVIGGSASSLMALIRAQSCDHPNGQSLVMGRTKEERGHIDSVALGTAVHALEVRSSPVSFSYGLEFSMRAALAAGQLRDTTLLHGHSGRWHYVGASRALASRLRVPWVHTLYCPIPATSPAARVLPRLASSATAIVGMSCNIARSAIAAGIPEARVHHIDPCIDTVRFRQRGSREETREKLRLPLDAEVVLFVGNARSEKGFDTLWQAFQTLAQEREKLMLVATFEDKGENASLRNDDPRASLDRCRFLGVVRDMSDLMEAANVAIFPFRNTDGPSDYPTAMLEAMAIGTPVVATSVGGIPEVVADGETGLLIPKDNPEALASAIERTLDYPETAAQIAANAEQLIHRRFRPDVVSRRWQELYDEIASRPGEQRFAA